jgi:hypothetical protein
VGLAQEAIKKKGYFKAYEDHISAFEQEHCSAVKQARLQLAELDAPASGDPGTSKKSKKSKEAIVEAVKADPTFHATLEADITKANAAVLESKTKADQAAADMFQLYANLLSMDAKYAWNKIVTKQTVSDHYTDLQGCSNSGPRGFYCKLFDDCMMVHLLTVFSNNAAEQEWYYFTNVLKKPQLVSIHQFVQRVEQLNSYILQLPCWYYSPSTKPNRIPMNVCFAKADLASHALCMCQHTWQDHFNLHEKGMTPIDMFASLVF